MRDKSSLRSTLDFGRSFFYQLETTGPPKTLSRELVDSETRTELKPQVQTVFTDKNPNATETKVVPPSHWANIDNNIAVVE